MPNVGAVSRGAHARTWHDEFPGLRKITAQYAIVLTQGQKPAWSQLQPAASCTGPGGRPISTRTGTRTSVAVIFHAHPRFKSLRAQSRAQSCGVGRMRVPYVEHSVAWCKPPRIRTAL